MPIVLASEREYVHIVVDDFSLRCDIASSVNLPTVPVDSLWNNSFQLDGRWERQRSALKVALELVIERWTVSEVERPR